MNDPNNPSDPQTEMLEAIESDLRISVDLIKEIADGPMVEMIEYHLGWHNTSIKARGKRFRPLLSLLCCQAAGGDWHAALPLASSLELIHNFSLVHDDIQDGSDIRRGQPTVWKRWGIPQAINTGDAIFVLARLAALRMTETGIPTDSILRALSIIDTECLNLTKGQCLDLEFERQARITDDEYIEMVSGKTCALLRAATQCGALVAGRPQAAVEDYRSFGHHLGLAFQIVDDILGIWGQSEVTGKSSVGDLISRKKTLPVVVGLANSPEFSKLWSAEGSSPGDIENMRRTLEETGADEYARKAADEATSQALQALKNANPMEPAATELEKLASRLQTRDR
jgi:geranylgeranyl diphosphate synthase type I